MRMTHRPIPLVLALLAAAALAACGKHHHGSVVPAPSPSPTLNPACKALSPQTTGSTYTLQSNPGGLTVQRVDPSVTTTSCVYFTGVTQTTDTPQTAPHPWQYVFAPQQASPYVVNIAQELNGSHTLFYNQAGDSTGAILASSLQSVRRTNSIASGAGVLQRGLHRFSGPGVATGEVLVRFRAGGSAAQMRARSSQIAVAEGAASGTEIMTARGAYERFISVPAGTDAATFAAKLRAQSDVADVFPAHVRVPLGRPNPSRERSAREQRRPVVPVRRRISARVVLRERRDREDRDDRHRAWTSTIPI